MSEESKVVKDRIRELVAEHGTQRNVSKAIGIDECTLSRVLSGMKPSASVVAKLGLMRRVIYVRAVKA